MNRLQLQHTSVCTPSTLVDEEVGAFATASDEWPCLPQPCQSLLVMPSFVLNIPAWLCQQLLWQLFRLKF